MVQTVINGRAVTDAEADAWFARRRALFGDDYFDLGKRNGRAPEVRTNDTFFRGKKHGTDLDMNDETFAFYKHRAEQAGQSINGKYYFSQVANGCADPEAWCGSTDEVIAKAKKEQLRIEINGRTYDFRQKYHDEPDDKPYEVAQDIVDREVAADVEKEGGRVSKKRRKQIEEQVRKELTPDSI